MKLIYCTNCHDIVLLTYEHRTCECSKARGHYEEDGLHAVISGTAIPLGIHNGEFRAALANRPKSGQGRIFKAFVIPTICETVWSEG